MPLTVPLTRLIDRLIEARDGASDAAYAEPPEQRRCQHRAGLPRRDQGAAEQARRETDPFLPSDLGPGTLIGFVERCC